MLSILLFMTFIVPMIVYLFMFGSIIGLIISTVILLLLMFRSEEPKSLLTGIVTIITGIIFNICTRIKTGTDGTLSGLDKTAKTFGVLSILALIGTISLIFFCISVKDVFAELFSFFKPVKKGVKKVNENYTIVNETLSSNPTLINDEKILYYLNNNSYINWLSNYMKGKDEIKSRIDIETNEYKVLDPQTNLLNIKRFYESLLKYCEIKNKIVCNNLEKKCIYFSYNYILYEIGLYKQNGGYIYCKKINIIPNYEVLNFENILQTKLN